MTYRKYKYHRSNPKITTSIQYAFMQEFVGINYGFHVYDALRWKDLPWSKTAFIFKVGHKSCGKLLHFEAIFYRWMIRFCVST